MVTLTALGIRTLAQWLMKQRARGQFEYRVEIVDPNGERRTETVKLAWSSSEPAPAEVIEKLGASLGLDQQLIADALQAAQG